MVAAVVLAYFLIVIFVVSLVVFPAWRARVIATFWGALHHGALPFANTAGAISSLARYIQQAVVRGAGNSGRFVSTNPWLSTAAGALVITPTLLAFFIHGPAVFDFAEDTGITDRQIAILLEGEQLVPPPLPPEVFTTKEVEMVRPDALLASRNWSLLDTEFTQRLLVVFKLMKERYGYEMVLLEGYRSPERQARLYEQGAHVTQVGANMSYHQYGLAADSAFFREGKVVISERDQWAMRGYQLYGEIAAQVGLTWGGNWKMQDYGHVELRRAGVLGRIATK